MKPIWFHAISASLAVIVSVAVCQSTSESLPVGTIVPSMLDPEMFIRLFGGQQSGDADEVTWVPADGRAVMGSRYEALIGYSVPDLRGMFLRGLNRSERSRVRNDGFEDPWDDREAGSRQGDEWQSHVWYLKHVTGNAGDDPRGKTAIGDVYTKDSDAETRPKNVAVFYYVKIN